MQTCVMPYRIKKLVFILSIICFIPHFAQAQSTEGKSFLVTFMRADSNDPQQLSLTVSGKRPCEITITNPRTGFSENYSLTAADKGIKFIDLTSNKNECYVGDESDAEISTNKALLVTSTENISLFAGNWREKSFDVANVLPISALLSEYIIQTYPPTDHGGTSQGSHFAIVAAEDNTVVDFVPTVNTYGMLYGKYQDAQGLIYYPNLGDTLHTDTLMAGQVFYVWTGSRDGDDADLSGTYLKARNSKKIAVFNGNAHTNIPDKIRDRDQLYEQAMPTAYWGTQFVATTSMTRKRDKIRVLALNDATEVNVIYNNGADTLRYTFDFATNPKRTFEFELGEKILDEGVEVYPNYLNGESCFIETSCPCAVHLFMVSNRCDYPDKSGLGDPAMAWINPIEQVINEISFATFKDYNHYVNIITDSVNASSMTLDGNSIAGNFQPVSGNALYRYARMNIASGTHLLEGERGFIAHAYGFGEKESYAYSVGGSTKPLEQSITINGNVYSADTENVLCDKDGTIEFTCQPNYEVENIVWNFGDGSPMVSGKDSVAVSHYYALPGFYAAYVLVSRLSSNLCKGQVAVDSIPITVNIENLSMRIDSVSEFICAKEGAFKVYYVNETGGAVTGASIKFGNDALAQGFIDDDLQIEPTYFVVNIPAKVEPARNYTAQLVVKGDCADEELPLSFMVNYAADSILTQRWNDVLAVKTPESITGGYKFQSFQWYKNGVIVSDSIGGTRSYIYLAGTEWNMTDKYHVQLTNMDGLTLCTCPIELKDKTEDMNSIEFLPDIQIKTTTAKTSSKIKVEVPDVGSVTFWNITGNRVSMADVQSGLNYVCVPDRAGIFFIHVLLSNGDHKTQKINVVD